MSLPDEVEEERDPLGDRIIARLAALTKGSPVWVWIVAVVVILFLMAIVSGANGGNNSASQPAPAAVQAKEAPAPTPEPKTEPEPEPAEYTTSEALAAVDGRWADKDLYEKRFAQILERCPNNEGPALGDAIYSGTLYMDERGITEDSIWAMESILGSISPSEAGTFDCVEVLSLAVSLRVP